MKQLQISAIVAGSVLLGTMLLVSNTFTPKVDAQQESVTEAFCAPEKVQHWDKIQFRIRGTYIITTSQPGGNVSLSALVNDPNKPWDIKVLDDPTKVADIEAKVRNFLANSPMIDTGSPSAAISTIALTPNSKIIIDDIEYEIVCVRPIR
jgi:hypothetical protein